MKNVKVGPFLPLAAVSTVLVGVNVGTKPNYIAVGFVGGANINPPILGVSLNRKHYSVAGLLENGTFSVNVPASAHMELVDYCGLVSGRNVDKAALVSTFYGELGTAPMIAGFPIVCECRYTGQRVDFAMDTMFFGQVVQSYVREDLYIPGKPADVIRIDPLLSGLDKAYHMIGSPLGKTFSVGWSKASGILAETGSTNIARPSLINRGPRHTLTVSCEADAASTGKAIATLRAYAESLGVRPLEGPFIRRTEGVSPETRIEVGFTIKTEISGSGEIQSGKMDGGRYAHTSLSGPHEGLREAHASLHALANASGLSSRGSAYEFYANDPQTTNPADLKTELFLPLKKK